MLDAGLISQIQRLRFVVHRTRAGQAQGERRSTKRGTSVEFADYRDYTRGDDLRRVDWNIYARLERPFVKLFEEEEDLAVHILLDGSGSMDWGGEGEARRRGDAETGRHGDVETRGPGSGKWEYARRLAAALGTIALSSGDRLSITLLQSSSSNVRGAKSEAQAPTADFQLPTSNLQLRGKGQTLRLFEWLSGLEAGGVTDLNAGLRRHALTGGRAGLAMLISDLFSPPGYAEGLTALAARGYEVTLIHLLAPDEVEPPLEGDLRLVDIETGEQQEVTVDGEMRSLYRRRLAAWREEIRTACRSRHIHYITAVNDAPIEQFVLTDLRREGLVR